MILPCVILAVQTNNGIAFHIGGEAQSPGINGRAGEAGAVTQLLLLNIDVQIGAIGSHIDGVSNLQTVGGGNGFRENAHITAVHALAFGEITTVHNARLFPGKSDLITQLVHRKDRESMVADLHFFQNRLPKGCLLGM